MCGRDLNAGWDVSWWVRARLAGYGRGEDVGVGVVGVEEELEWGENVPFDPSNCVTGFEGNAIVLSSSSHPLYLTSLILHTAINNKVLPSHDSRSISQQQKNSHVGAASETTRAGKSPERG